MPIMPYDTESKSRNVLASPLGEEGHEVAKGCTRVRMIMILDVDVTAERRHYNTHRPLKGKRLTTFCASLVLLHPLLSLTHWIRGSLLSPMNPVPLPPQGETRNLRRKTESHILHVPLRHSPFGGWRHHLSAPLGSVSLDSQSPTAPCESSSLATASGGTIKLRYAVSCL